MLFRVLPSGEAHVQVEEHVGRKCVTDVKHVEETRVMDRLYTYYRIYPGVTTMRGRGTPGMGGGILDRALHQLRFPRF